MVRVLAVADEVVESWWTGSVQTDRVRRRDVDLVLAAGDLPFEYLAFLASALDRPCVFVPGNHDPDLSGYTRRRGLWLRAGLPAAWPGPPGGTNADGRVLDVAGLRIAGLGGSLRYREGPNQYTEAQQARRARRLARRARWRGGTVDVLLTHAPPRNCGDRPDPPHHGFGCLHDAVRRIRPRWLLHGHIHPHGEPTPDRELGSTLVRNVVGHRVFDIEMSEPGALEVGSAP